MGWALGKVRDVKEYVLGLELSLTGRCSPLEGLRIKSQFSDRLELTDKELWRAVTFFGGR